MAKRVMHQLHLKRIAAVDRPCQEGATAAIFKRAEDGVYFAKGKEEADLPAPVETYLKRSFSDSQRKDLASSGAALPDGSYPIETRGDLKNAIQAYGRAKNPAKAKAHIVSRARSLDATSLLPADWKVGKMELLLGVTNDDAMEGLAGPIEVFLGEMGAVDFDSVMAEVEAREYANCLLEEIDEAVCSLRTVFWEINDDGAVADKAEALQESLAQFKAHIQGIIPEGLENAIVKAALSEAGFEFTEGGALTKRENDMAFSIELKKSLGLPATANDADVNKALEIQKGGAQFALNVLKMSPEHLAYMGKAAQLQTADGIAKQEFAALDAAGRDEVIKKFPPAMSDKEKADAKAKADADAEDAKKRADDVAKSDETLTIDGNEIRKSVVGAATFAIFKSQQAAIEKAADERAVSVIEKRASTDLVHVGKSDELAVMLHGIAKRDPKLAEQVEGVLKAADAKIAKGALFTEVGKSSQTGAGGSATAQIESLAQAEVAKGTYKNIFKARDGVRKANAELAKQEETERKVKTAA